MELEKIRALAGLMEENGLCSLELCEGDDTIVLQKSTGQPVLAAPAAAPAAAVAAPAAEAPPLAPAGETLDAPLVGCVYLSPSPEAPAYVKVGDHVKKGQVLCIVEAMKVMNEYPAPKDGVIAEICVENGQLVEYGQPLFRLG